MVEPSVPRQRRRGLRGNRSRVRLRALRVRLPRSAAPRRAGAVTSLEPRQDRALSRHRLTSRWQGPLVTPGGWPASRTSRGATILVQTGLKGQVVGTGLKLNNLHAKRPPRQRLRSRRALGSWGPERRTASAEDVFAYFLVQTDPLPRKRKENAAAAPVLINLSTEGVN